MKVIDALEPCDGHLPSKIGDNTMDPISKDIAHKFCEGCNWVYETWVTHKLLFDDNNNPGRNIGKAGAFTERLSSITQEYCLQQIAKLHDPAIQRNSKNLTIDYMMRFGEWGERKTDIEKIEAQLQRLWKCIRPARNKALAHNDLETLMADAPLGSFPDGLDDQYFDALQALANEVHEKWVGGPYPFNNLAQNDVIEFLTLLERA
ncbi:MAG: hypothetical protein QF830_08295 [Rhodospirillales bacterium]|nr:hypothetical protein [Rhodospirillales bacterium]